MRNLLRDFRAGKIEQALRRALPLGGPRSRPVVPGVNARLPVHTLFYSLRNLLAGRHGPASAWFAGGDIFYSLQAEYRKQAEEAMKRGDYRRAAFIYAKLLDNVGSAAHALSQGGLHADAAQIYEVVLRNLPAAARAWSAAGEIDRAVELYERLGDDLNAGDLLQRVGASERALTHFRRGADKLAAREKYAEAGEVLFDRAGRPDLALQWFEQGWQSRPKVAAAPCGVALAKHYAREPNPPRFLQLLSDAQVCVQPWTNEALVSFVNDLARLANQPTLAAIADVAHDRCLMTIAEKMRKTAARARMPSWISFPPIPLGPRPWPAMLTSRCSIGAAEFDQLVKD